MKTIIYLQFAGNAKEAVAFYANVFQASQVKETTFGAMGDNPEMPLTNEEKLQVMEACIEFNDSVLMLSDVLPSMQQMVGEIKLGNQTIISVIDADESYNQEVFNKLSEGGRIIMPLTSAPWSSSFGMLVDKFGITWKFNSDASKFLNSFEG